ncbi:MAG: AMP-binding protein [Kiloniellaceae bacterium]
MEFPQGKVLRLSFEEALASAGRPAIPAALHPLQTAYLIYTSGSTGKPKAVTVTRQGLAHYTAGILDRLQLPEAARLAMVSTVAADLGNTVVFAALCGGGELHLIDPARTFDPDRFSDYMETEGVEVLKIVPSHLEALLQAGKPECVLPAHTLVLGGETSNWSLIDRISVLAPSCRVFNHYGPTEATVGVLCQDAGTANRRAGSLPIGMPLAAVSTQVLDGYLNPVPQGVAGELYLGGPGIARGYLGRAGQTAERFVPDPCGVPGDRLYRSGDRVKHLPDGSLEFLGRVDDQVKIRGYRVEPNEVALALRRVAGILDAAVLPTFDETGRQQLTAYVVAEGAQQLEQAKTQLAGLLPDQMVPTLWLRMDALPLTPNGKLDRRALPETASRRAPEEPPQGKTEQALAQIWGSLLGRAGIGRQDNFAALGGDSILSLKMLARIRREGLEGSARLSLADVLNASTLAALAALIAPAEKNLPDIVFLQRKGLGVPLFCIPGLIANSTEFATMVEALGGDRPVTGFVSHVLTEQRWRGYDMAPLAAGYADYIESQAGEGRCALLGWSSGGDLAFDTAHRLRGRVDIEFLGMVDVFESVPFLPARALDPNERKEAGRRIDSWLGASQMAAQWRESFALMGPREREALEEYVLSYDGPLPVDGPEMTSREFELWAILDKRLRARRYTYRPLDVGIHVWQAEDSLTRPERLRDWSELAPVIDVQIVAGARHLDIIHKPAFLDGVKVALRAIDVEAAATA